MELVAVEDLPPRNYQELKAFYDENPHPNVRPRPNDVLEQAVQTHVFTVFRDAKAKICGAAGIFDYVDSDYFEIGATIVLTGGFGLQKLLIAIRLLSISSNTSGDVPVFTIIKKSGAEKSHSSIEKMGFVLWPEPDSKMIEDRCSTLNILPPQDVNYYIFEWTPEHLRNLAETFLRFYDQSKLSRNGRTVSLRFDHRWLDRPDVLPWIRSLAEN